MGNTCMHHLFLGISPASLVHAPYTPAVSERLVLNAGDYGLAVQERAELIMLSDIAGYVGADTCGCLLSIRQDQQEEISLMIDIGTNGEMVLGNRERMVTCSTAAGPAFEGAKIECGMRGAAGAVDHVKYEDGKWNYTTVGNKPAVGLCGSGLIDLVAGLLDAGMLDENGVLRSGQEKQGVFILWTAILIYSYRLLIGILSCLFRNCLYFHSLCVITQICDYFFSFFDSVRNFHIIL